MWFDLCFQRLLRLCIYMLVCVWYTVHDMVPDGLEASLCSKLVLFKIQIILVFIYNFDPTIVQPLYFSLAANYLM